MRIQRHLRGVGGPFIDLRDAGADQDRLHDGLERDVGDLEAILVDFGHTEIDK